MSARRVAVLWCPDWPVMVYRDEVPNDVPLAVLASGEVLACSPAAREQGVRRGMRRRDAQARCPELVVKERKLLREIELFDHTLTTLAAHAVDISVLRPGLCALPVPSRFHGGELAAAAVMLEAMVTAGVWDVRCGIADGVFAAEQAARLAGVQEVNIVPLAGSTEFLGPLPVEIFGDDDFTSLLKRLGLAYVSQFSALAPADVHTRFGALGLGHHRVANGIERAWLGQSVNPHQISREVFFEPALDNSETLAFSSRALVADFVAELVKRDVVCTAATIELIGERDMGSRVWRHPRWFSQADLTDRIRWQARVWAEPVAGVRILSETLESAGDQADDLFGGGAEEAVERGVARVQSMIGPEGVEAQQVQGGRSPAERRLASVWGERAVAERRADAPWPASIPAPAPATVFREPHAAKVVGAEGHVVAVNDRGGLLGGAPERVLIDQQWHAVAAWAGPWPVDERWWDEANARRVARFQVVGVDGSAWLMSVDSGQWWLEAVYD